MTDSRECKTCGRKPIIQYLTDYDQRLTCPDCGVSSVTSTSFRKALTNWNIKQMSAEERFSLTEDILTSHSDTGTLQLVEDQLERALTKLVKVSEESESLRKELNTARTEIKEVREQLAKAYDYIQPNQF